MAAVWLHGLHLLDSNSGEVSHSRGHTFEPGSDPNISLIL